MMFCTLYIFITRYLISGKADAAQRKQEGLSLSDLGQYAQPLISEASPSLLPVGFDFQVFAFRGMVCPCGGREGHTASTYGVHGHTIPLPLNLFDARCSMLDLSAPLPRASMSTAKRRAERALTSNTDT